MRVIFLDTALSLNSLKNALVQTLNTLEDSNDRRALRKQVLPNVSTLQLYRSVPVFRDTPSKVAVSWKVQRATGKKITVKALRALVRQDCLIGRISSELRVSELKAIESLKGGEVVNLRRSVSPFVVANVKLEGGWQEPVNAALPLLVLKGKGEIKVSDLCDFPPMTLWKRGSIKFLDEPLFTRSAVRSYRYKLEFREFE